MHPDVNLHFVSTLSTTVSQNHRLTSNMSVSFSLIAAVALACASSVLALEARVEFEAKPNGLDQTVSAAFTDFQGITYNCAFE
jgi:hypothetical protein